jgi:hypothetical protein
MKAKDVIVRIQSIKEQNERVFMEDLKDRNIKNSIMDFKIKTMKKVLRKTYPLGYVGQRKTLVEL